MGAPGVAARSSEHFAAEFGSGLTARQLIEAGRRLAPANDLLPAAAAVVDGLVPVRRALMRLLARPIGLSGSGPTLWALYPSRRRRGPPPPPSGRPSRPAIVRRPATGRRSSTPRRSATDEPTADARERRMTRQAIQTNGAPAALGPYSQGIASGEFVFCSGQIGLDPSTGELADGLEAQAERALRNLQAVLDAAGLSFDDVVKTTIFLADVNDFAAVNAIYAKFMPIRRRPARRSASAALPKSGLVEIEAIARRRSRTRSPAAGLTQLTRSDSRLV